jgi:serine/threonine-protein kinase
VIAPVEVGQVLAGKYRVERMLGAGGMGVVVAATHLELGQRVAMKFLLAEGMGSPEIAARFMREARAAARIRGEHVARVIDVGRLESGSPYIVMEYLEGLDLEQLVKKQVVSIEEAVDYLIQACDAMAEAHRLGIIHRDLKPANLFLAHGVDGQGVVKVLDFGISKSSLDAAAGSLTSTSALVGSPLYMSPEQMRSSRNVDHRTDIWSLGAVLFELLARRPPYEGETVGELMARVLTDPLPSIRSFRADIPVGLEAVIARCLEKNPDARFANVAELSQALTPFAPQHSVMAVERVHRILGSVRPPPTSSAPPPSISSLPPPSAVPHFSQPPGVARTSEPARSLAAGKTLEAEVVGKGTTLGWGGERKKSGQGGRQVLLASAGLVIVAGLAAFTFLRPKPPAPEPASVMSRATAAAGSPPAPTPAPAPEIAPAPVLAASGSPNLAADASAAASASAPAAASAQAPTQRGPRPQGAVHARVDAAASAKSAPPEHKGKDSRLHMELKK